MVARGPRWGDFRGHLVGRVLLNKPGFIGVVQGKNVKMYSLPRDEIISEDDTFMVRFIDYNGEFHEAQTMKVAAVRMLTSERDKFVCTDVWSESPELLDAQQNNWQSLPATGFVRSWTPPVFDNLRSVLRELLARRKLRRAGRKLRKVPDAAAPVSSSSEEEEELEEGGEEDNVVVSDASEAEEGEEEEGKAGESSTDVERFMEEKEAARFKADVLAIGTRIKANLQRKMLAPWTRLLEGGAHGYTVLSIATNRLLPADECAIKNDFCVGTPDEAGKSFVVSAILDESVRADGVKYYLLKWQGYEVDARYEGHWEPEASLQQDCKAVLTAWNKRRPAWWTEQKDVKAPPPPAAVAPKRKR